MSKVTTTVVPVDRLEVASWSPGEVTQGDACTQVHVLWSVSKIDALFVMRIKSREAADELINALIENRDEVWPEAKGK